MSFGPLKILILQATEFCNIECRYCYLPERNTRHVMPIETIEQTIKKSLDHGFIKNSLRVSWHSGEPLAAPISYFESAIRVIRELIPENTNLSFELQTNGTLINQNWADFFKDYSIDVSVSIDGPKRFHDSNRKFRNGQGTHEYTLRGIEILKSNGFDLKVLCVLTQELANHPEEFYDFIFQIGVDSLAINIEEKEGSNKNAKLNFTQHQLKNFFERLFQINQERKKISIREYEVALKGIRNIHHNTTSYYERTLQTIPYRMLNVAYNGEFSTFSPELLGHKSSKYNNFTLGNINTDSLLGDEQLFLLKKMLTDINEGLSNCKSTCAFFEACGGGMPSNKFFESGTFSSTETQSCKNHIQIPILAEIANRENRSTKLNA